MIPWAEAVGWCGGDDTPLRSGRTASSISNYRQRGIPIQEIGDLVLARARGTESATRSALPVFSVEVPMDMMELERLAHAMRQMVDLYEANRAVYEAMLVNLNALAAAVPTKKAGGRGQLIRLNLRPHGMPS